MSEHTSDPNRTFVLGLDGVPWQRLEEWIDAGELPNFERVRSSGVAGPLESTMPPTTPLAWPTITTGVWPDDHGVYWFRNLTAEYDHEPVTSDQIDRPQLWNHCSPSVVANVPMTYPVEDIDGAMVAGMMSPDTGQGFAQPASLRAAIDERIPDYEVGLRWAEYKDRKDAFLSELHDLVEARAALMDLLMERAGADWQLFFFVYTAPDRLQHLCWDEATLLEHYRKLDGILGRVLAYVRERDANLFVVSDHGFGPLSTSVSVNAVLKRNGYLSLRSGSGSRSVLGRLGVTKDRLSAGIDRLGLDQTALVRSLPDALVDRVAASVPGSHVLYDVDFSETLAFVHGPGALYVNDTERFESGAVDPAARDALAAEIATCLERVTDPATGDRVLETYAGDELFPADDRSPDLIVRAADGYKCVTELRDDVFRDTGAMEGGHRRDGIFMACGPDVDAGGEVRDATVVDVAPTVLHSLDEGVPEWMDGRVLAEALAGPAVASTATGGSSPDPQRNSGGQRETGDEDFSDVEARLRGLGYMD